MYASCHDENAQREAADYERANGLTWEEYEAGQDEAEASANDALNEALAEIAAREQYMTAEQRVRAVEVLQSLACDVAPF